MVNYGSDLPEIPKRRGADDDEEREVRKSSTLNSMYINTTISKPCVDSIINAVATILHSQMLEVSRHVHPNCNLTVILNRKSKCLSCSIPFYLICSFRCVFHYCRTWAKAKKSLKIVNCFTSPRRSTSKRSPTLSISRELRYLEKHLQLSRFLILSRPSSIVLNFRKFHPRLKVL